MAERPKPRISWIEFLDDEDTAFLKRFILLSGSLKDMASAYGVSYPTVRLRLDRLIAKVTAIENLQIKMISSDSFVRSMPGGS